MDILRLVLIIIGVLILGGIYLYSTRKRGDSTRDAVAYDPRDVTNNNHYNFDYTPVTLPSGDVVKTQQSEPDILSGQLAQLGDVISQYKSKPAPRGNTKQHRSVIHNKETAPDASVRNFNLFDPPVEIDNSRVSSTLPETPPDNNQPQAQIPEQILAAPAPAQNNDVGSVEGFPQIIVLNITARHGVPFQGAEILNAVRAAGMEFGDTGIFHRFNSGNGRRRPIFSLANILEPGSFDCEDMAAFSTAGLTLFMQLPAPIDNLLAYEDMLNTAQAVANTLNGDVCDERRNMLTLQAIDHTREQLREFNYKIKVARKRAEQQY